MNKTVFTGIVIAVVVLIGLVWVARPNPQSTSAVSSDTNGALTVEEANNYDFGTISMAKGVVKHQFKIKNIGDEPVIINKMYTSCMCTTAELIISGKKSGPFGMSGHGIIPRIDQTINPNEEAAVSVAFDPAAHGPAGIGAIRRTITLENNAREPILLYFSAMVTP